MRRVVFCGVGAIGSHAVTFCRHLNMTAVLVDHDRVESKNTQAQAYTKQAIGKLKVEALRQQLLTFWSIRVESIPVELGPHNMSNVIQHPDLVVDCLDNKKSRDLVTAYAMSRAIPHVHAAISGDGSFGLVRWDGFVADEETPGQPTCEGGEHLPIVVSVASALARAIQEFLSTGRKLDFMIARQR